MSGPFTPPTGAEFIGVTSYKMSPDRPNCFLSTYYSTRFGEPRVLASGIALGDTSDGFVGDFKIRYYEPDGQPLKDPRPYDLKVVRRDDVVELSWSRDDTVRLIGFGIVLGDQMVATYWRPI